MSAVPAEPASAESLPATARPRLTTVPRRRTGVHQASLVIPSLVIPSLVIQRQAGATQRQVGVSRPARQAGATQRRVGVSRSAAPRLVHSPALPLPHSPGHSLHRSPGHLLPHSPGRPGGLHLTRRGRVVLIAAATLVAILLGFAVTGGAMATDHGAPASASHRGLSRVVVQPGQTLWSIAVRAEPSADPRLIVQRIIEINDLGGGSIAAGQRLWIPRG
jgi:hypothetical protein